MLIPFNIENSDQLESTIIELESSLETQHAEANEAIVQWEARCTALQEQIEKMEDQWIQNDIVKSVEKLKAELAVKQQKIDKEERQIEELQSSLSGIKKELSYRFGGTRFIFTLKVK